MSDDNLLYPWRRYNDEQFDYDEIVVDEENHEFDKCFVPTCHLCISNRLIKIYNENDPYIVGLKFQFNLLIDRRFSCETNFRKAFLNFSQNPNDYNKSDFQYYKFDLKQTISSYRDICNQITTTWLKLKN